MKLYSSTSQRTVTLCGVIYGLGDRLLLFYACACGIGPFVLLVTSVPEGEGGGTFNNEKVLFHTGVDDHPCILHCI